ncbi:hypothetical protein EEJ42_23715 [Streptomyces botrytidirepellens]|uniref:HTH cro/C1-type domain-containing protein n=2 Tax=Streptomyces botrytidirepellens TaxID=2486417 RepID=A0A3M8VRM6_9ACTN|nr:hypothetical protein EEJ42_23715 [Streptomyces botrytidirepellens]
MPVDPARGPVQRFAFELRTLRAQAGGVTYRSLAQRAGYSVTTLSQAAAGEQLPTLPVVLAYVRACGGDVPQWETRWKEAVQEVAAADADPDDDGQVPPYRGLERFETSDRGRFFGRDRLTVALLDLLQRRRFAVVFGPSGSGKSSLLRAGLIPALQHSQEPGLRSATIRILTPGNRPARTHGHLLAPSETSPGTDTFVIVDQFEETFTFCQDPTERARFIDLLLAARRPASGLRVLLAVRADFYGHCAEHPALADALRDANLLVGPMSPAELREAVVKPAAACGLTVERTLTARLVEEVTRAPGGLPLLSHVLLETWRRRRGKTMTTASYEAAGGLEGAIAKTAEEVYDRFTQGQSAAARRLLLRLVAPGDGTPDTRRPTERAELRATGGQRTEAGQVLEALARARLLTLDETRVELAHEVLLTAWPRLHRWIEEDRERLRAHRRLTEAAHAWEELGRDPGAVYRGSRLAAAESHFSGAERLEDLTALEHAFLTASLTTRDQEEHAATRTTRRLRRLRAVLSAVVALALVAGMIAWQRSESEEQERLRTEARRIAALADSLRATDPATAMRLSTASWSLADLPETRSALVGALSQREQDAFTDPSMDPAAVRYLSGEGRTLVSVGAKHVVMWDVRTHRRTAVRRGLSGDVDNAGTMSPNARALTVLRDDRTRLWDLPGGHAASRPLPASAGAEFAPSGRRLALYRTEGPDDVIQLRDRAGRILMERRLKAAAYRTDRASTTIPIAEWNKQRMLRQRPFAPYPFPDAVMSADDRLMALCVPGRAVEIWNVPEQRRLPAPWAPDATADNCLEEDFQFTPNGRRLALLTTSGLRMWDLASGRQLPTIKHTGLREIEFSADGRFLAASTADEILLWRIGTPGTPVLRHALTGESAGELRLDLDERRLRYLAGRSGTVVRSLALDTVLDQRWKSEAAVAAAFSPDGTTLATAHRDADRTRIRVRLTDTRSGRRIADLPTAACPEHSHGLRPPVPCTVLLAFSPDNHTLAYTPTDHYLVDGAKAITRVSLWDIPAHHSKPSFSLARPQDRPDEILGQVNAITFTTDARSLLVSRIPDGETVRVWDVRSGTMTKETAGIGGEVLAPHPDGHLLATSHGQILDLRSGQVTRRALNQDDTTALAYSPDGKYLAAGDSSGRVTLWNSHAGQLLGVLSPPAAAGLEDNSEKISSVAFSHDGRTLAAADNSGALRLWDTSSSQPIGSALPTTGGAFLALAFSTDDKVLHAAGEHLPLQTFAITPDKIAAAVCRRAGALTPVDWKIYIRDLPYRRTC